MNAADATGRSVPPPRPRPAPPSDPVLDAVARLGDGPLTEAAVREHVKPLFSRVLARPGIYLANHSLGRPLDRTADDVREAVDLWYADMDDAWIPWLDELRRFRRSVASLIGLGDASAVVPKTAAGQGLRAVLNAIDSPKPRVVATRGEFDSLDFILKTYAARGRAEVTWVEPTAGPDHRGSLPDLFEADAIIDAVRRGPAPDLVVVSQICFGTGQLMTDLPRVVTAAHAVRALVLLDTYHSAGVVPVRFDELGPDFAVGGAYKYLRGGPGACWLAIHPRHLRDAAAMPAGRPRLRTLDTGWFAKRDPFSYARPDTPELSDGGDAWLESTPAVLPFYQARAGLDFTLAIGVDRLRSYNLAQQALLAGELRARDVRVREIDPRGAFLLLPHPDAAAWCATLRSRGLIADARGPHIRLCPDILTSAEEMERAAEIVADSLG